MTCLWATCCAFLAVILELVASRHGVGLPVFGVMVFYLTAVQGWPATTAIVLVCATVLDLALGRQWPATALAVPGLQLLAEFWRRHGDCRQLGPQAVIGLAVGSLVGGLRVVLLLLPGSRWQAGLAAEVAGVLAESILGGAVLLPLACRGLDGLAESLRFNTYYRAQERR